LRCQGRPGGKPGVSPRGDTPGDTRFGTSRPDGALKDKGSNLVQQPPPVRRGAGLTGAGRAGVRRRGSLPGQTPSIYVRAESDNAKRQRPKALANFVFTFATLAADSRDQSTLIDAL